MSKKVVFISTVNIFDKKANGGEKASCEHFRMLQNCFGKDNVFAILFVPKVEIDKVKENAQIKVIPKISGNAKLFIAALFGCRVYMPWKEKNILKDIDKINPDILFLDFSFAGRLLRKRATYKTVAFFHNMEADYTYNKVKNEGIIYYPAYLAAKRNDRWAACADCVLCFNDRDAKRMEKLYGRKADATIPITMSDQFDASKTNINYKRDLLFLGSLFGPNQDGVEWFIQNVMPALKDIRLTIVGKNFESKKEQYENYKNVCVVGSVDNPSEYYYKHCAVVMPIRYGAGMKVKTAEAMMYGRHIFASDEALEGYSVDNVKGIIRCNSAEEYVKKIQNYFDNEEKYAFESDVRDKFLEEYEINAVQKKFAIILSSLDEN